MIASRGFEDDRYEQTRRALLAKAGLGAAAAGVGVAALAPEDALASTVTGWINVKDPPYEAGTGTYTNDAPRIQLAIDDAVTQGAAVFFPPGTYKIGSTLRMKTNTHLKGSGQLKSKLLATSDLSKDKSMIINDGLGSGTPNHNIVIEDLELDGNKSGRTGSALGHLIFMRGTFPELDGAPSRQIHVRRIYGHDSPQMGITLQSCSDSEIVGCEIAHCDRDGADFWWNSLGCRMAYNYIHDCKDDFIALNAENVDTDGGYTLADITVVGNVLAGGGAGPGNGIRVAGAKRVTISGNVVRESFYNGIIVSNANSSAAEDIVISGNVIESAGHPGGQGSGIRISQDAFNELGLDADVRRVVIADNVVYLPRTHCVSIGGLKPGKTIAEISITNNLMMRPAVHGISIEGLGTTGNEVADVSISGNTLIGRSDGGFGIICNGPPIPVRRLSISHNRVRDWKFNGISLAGSNHSNHSIVGNAAFENGIRGNSGHGMSLRSINGLTVVGNRCRENKLAGIDLQDTVTETMVTGNDATGNLGQGINIANTTGQTLVTGNLVAGNTGAGIQRANLNASTYIFQNVGDDAPIARHLSATASWDPGPVGGVSPSTRSTTVVVTGASVGDTVAVGFTTPVQAPMMLSGAVTAANTVTVTLFNPSTNQIDLASGTLRADVWKH